ncbi:hypothetical protein [Amycolatopsis sp. NPDC051102]|uniref:hypothetical protein n=1 Tax=Amycolatopsis sp. NPDC051102 TaxID=3155163 RepID=UPI003416A758
MITGEIYLVFSTIINDAWRWLTKYRQPDWWAASGEWAGAVGTIAAVVVALGIAIRDGRAMRRESNAQSERERREHFSHLSAWPSRSDAVMDPVYPIKLLNSSSEQFYNVVVFPVFIQGTGAHSGEEALQDGKPEYGNEKCAVVGALPPGKWEVLTRFDTGILQGRPGVEIACTDRFGCHWIRRATGKVEEIPVNPLEHYKIERPFQYQMPRETRR